MKNKGFTLVEILIVVIILGILAAIVIPQFTEASNDARESALASDLQTVRSQVELYKIQHLDELPGVLAAVSFVQSLTMKTDVNGTLNATGVFGPYLQTFPTNPFSDDLVTEDAGAVPAAGGATGWYWDTTDGKFSPYDADHTDM